MSVSAGCELFRRSSDLAGKSTRKTMRRLQLRENFLKESSEMASSILAQSDSDQLTEIQTGAVCVTAKP